MSPKAGQPPAFSRFPPFGAYTPLPFFGLPVPAADLLLSHPYDILVADVIDVKDHGSGVIGGWIHSDYLTGRACFQILRHSAAGPMI